MSLIVDTPIVYSTLRSAAMAMRARNDVRERFGFAVRILREERGLTQEELAHRSGIHRTYLSDLERGTRNVALITDTCPSPLSRGMAC